MIIKQVAHICIGAYNLAETEHFYCDILGMERGFDFMQGGKRIGFYIKTGVNTFIEVFHQGETANIERPIIKHVCLEVDDMDATIEHLTSHGVAVTEKKFGPDNAWQAWITDPNDVSIELMQYTDSSTHFTGEPCILD